MLNLQKNNKKLILTLLTIITFIYSFISLLHLNKETTPLIYKSSVLVVNLVMMSLVFFKDKYSILVIGYLLSYTNFFVCVIGPKMNDIDRSVMEYFKNKKMF
ncbi:hypothetical protein TUBRATIS_28970 [Tubulinosema ratisbonensis]|uniref:Uncharacterized protein n=1 Tax=Tubulinosema ratisbonensis TaxID=291195 RepID=A0A437AHQ6_9MICR|nr:hypothetical protein TUBRATIS_28970 [Tubulinosema ratisbonensis]